MSKNWSGSNHNSEEEVPVPPLTKCTAIKDFLGEQQNDLPFVQGEVLTILEPCNVVYWYLAENKMGRRGIIPITYVQIHTTNHKVSSQKRPPPPPPPSDSPSPELPHNTTSSSSSKPLPPLPPKPDAPSGLPQVLPLPPKPQTASPAKPPANKKTYLTFPRLAHSPQEPRKKVTRVHSNEFRGAQPTHHTSLSRVHSNEFRGAQSANHTPLVNALTATSRDRPHRHSQPCPTHSPPLSNLPEIPPPLPSPRNRPKPVHAPIAPKMFSSQQSPLGSPSSSPPLGPSSQVNTSFRATSGGDVSRSGSDPLLDIDRRPPALLPSEASSSRTTNYYSKTRMKSTTKYQNQKEFMEKSGWFTPSLEKVLCQMMYSSHISTLTSVTTGVYIFTHKRQRTKRYVGKSRTCYHDLVQMFHRLFERKEDKLGMLEKEIKYNSPDADQWTFRIYSVSNPDSVEVEANKRIIFNNTLHPNGLNTGIRFSSKESFYQFAEVYAKMMREKATKAVNPIRAAQSTKEC